MTTEEVSENADDEDEKWQTAEPPICIVEFICNPAVLISCGDNLMTAAWLTPVSVEPFLYVVSVRKERHTYDLIKEHDELGINYLDVKHTDAIHYCGTKSGRDVNKFIDTGLTMKDAKCIESTLVEESDLILETKVVGEVPAGDHQLFICEVVCRHKRKDLPFPAMKPSVYLGKGYYSTISEPFKKG